MKKWLPVLVVPALLLVGCGDNSTAASSASVETDTAKYEQTWPKDYASTTCAEWSGEMTTQQQFAGAADVLASARNKIDGGTGLPSDALIREFQVAITDSCITPTWAITDASYTAYTDGAAQFKP